MKLVDFRARFPEFAKLPDPTIQDAITRASNQTDSSVWGNLTDESIGYLAAHFLALSPYGQQARLSTQDGNTTYMTHWRRLARLKTAGYARVTA